MTGEGEVIISVRVVPNAAKAGVVGWQEGEVLKVKVQAPPEGGRANDEICALLAETLALPKRAVRIVSGGTSRQKRVGIAGVTAAEARQRLAGAE